MAQNITTFMYLMPGKVVVEVGVFSRDLLISSTIRDEGELDRSMLCAAGGTVGIVTADGPRGLRTFARVFRMGNAGDFSCVIAGEDAGTGDRIVARITNPTGKPQKVLVMAGLFGRHSMLLGAGRGAQNRYWDCDARQGTAEEGMEGSIVGLWPRPIQDCSPSVTLTSSTGYLDRDTCPPPCP